MIRRENYGLEGERSRIGNGGLHERRIRGGKLRIGDEKDQ